MNPPLNFAPLPPGARDLLSEECRRRRRLAERLHRVFESWGYQPVATPAVEYYEVFGRGLATEERARCLRFLAGADEIIALRSDVTPQIARLVGQRLADRLARGELVRLVYAADVIRRPQLLGDGVEEHQVGVELIGDPSPAADAELIAIGHAALAESGVVGAVFDLAHVGVAQALLGPLDLPEPLRVEVLAALARKDLAGIDARLCDGGIPESCRRELRVLARLHGSLEVLSQARRLLSQSVRPALDQLEAVLDALAARAPAVLADLSLDLGEVRGHDYYSGVRLRVWAPGAPQPIARGGRYDRLLARYGVDAPATGLVLDLDRLASLTAGIRGSSPPASRIIVVEHGDRDADDAGASTSAVLRLAADREAVAARALGRRAWVEPGISCDGARELAERVGAAEIAVIRGGSVGEQPVGEQQDDAPQVVERWIRGPGGWRREGAGEGSER